MTRGAFRGFAHDHLFEAQGDATVMTDRIDFSAPFGVLGVLAERMFLTRYLTRLIQARAEDIKREAEERSA